MSMQPLWKPGDPRDASSGWLDIGLYMASGGRTCQPTRSSTGPVHVTLRASWRRTSASRRWTPGAAWRRLGRCRRRPCHPCHSFKTAHHTVRQAAMRRPWMSSAAAVSLTSRVCVRGGGVTARTVTECNCSPSQAWLDGAVPNPSLATTYRLPCGRSDVEGAVAQRLANHGSSSTAGGRR